MQTTHLLPAFHADFSFPAHPIFELKWTVLFSFMCLQVKHTSLLFDGWRALVFRLPLDSVHPMLSRFQLRSSKSPEPHLGVYSKSHPRT